MNLLPFVLGLFFAVVTFAMDGLENDDDVSLDIQTENIDEFLPLKNKLEKYCEVYKKDMEQIFGCNLCKITQAIFNPRVFNHAQERMLLAENLLAILHDVKDKVEDDLTLFTIFVDQADFASLKGKMFKQSCIDSIYLHYPSVFSKKKENPHFDDETLKCTSCLEKPRVVLNYPCRHLVSCTSCHEQWRSKSNTCPACRKIIRFAKILQEEEAKIICSICKKNLANTKASKCSHRVACKDCLRKLKKPFCPQCHHGKQKFYLEFF